MVSILAANIALILVVISSIFIVLKIGDKWTPLAFFENRKVLLYKIHVNAPKLAILLMIVHIFTSSAVSLLFPFSGWLIAIILIALAILGGFLGIKNNSKPMDVEKDLEWRKLRFTKWALTFLLLFIYIFHGFMIVAF